MNPIIQGSFLRPGISNQRDRFCELMCCTIFSWCGTKMIIKLSWADGRQRIWRRDGRRHTDDCVQQVDRFGGGSAMVWAGISTELKTDLHIIEGNITAERYLNEILRPVVVPFFNRHKDELSFFCPGQRSATRSPHLQGLFGPTKFRSHTLASFQSRLEPY